MDDISKEIDIIRKECSDDMGNELWFPMMIRYVEESPYGQKHSLMLSQTLAYSSPLYGRRTAQIHLGQIPFRYYHDFFRAKIAENSLKCIR